MPELIVKKGNETTRLAFEGTPLLSRLLTEQGFALQYPCGGKGVCGRCRLEAGGALSQAPRDGTVLACQTRLLGDAEVRLQEQESLQAIELLGALPPFELKPMAGTLGLAVDIGTTTLAAQLIDLPAGRLLSSAALENPQRQVSDNVIGRIEAALAGEGGRLKKLIADALRALGREAAAKAGVSEEAIDAWLITGNTTMLYLYEGRNPESLSRAPFKADCLFGQSVREGRVYLPRCIGAFLGADLVCAVLASRMCLQDETALLVDIGTNGEMALWHEGRLYCCATAAGPAFEGGGISCGLGSVPGAIDTVWLESGGLKYTTIMDRPAKGICGSGLVDAVASLLSLGRLEETGAMDGEELAIAPAVALGRKDIRNLQLAKGAIYAGIRTLCEEVSLPYERISTLYLAGGFGKHLNIESAAAIGLIPPALAEKVRVIGNAALTGAAMMLLNRDFLGEAAALAKGAEVVTLSGSSRFANNFVDAMMFGEDA